MKEPIVHGQDYVTLGDVIVDVKPGFAVGERDIDGVIQVRMNNVDVAGQLDLEDVIRVPATARQISDSSLKDGDVLFNNTNSTDLVGKSAIFRGHHEPVTFSNHFSRLRVNPLRLDPNYLARWLTKQQQSRLFERLCTRWVGQSAVRSETLLGLKIPLPSLKDQQRIAAILDKADAIRRKRQDGSHAVLRLLGSAYLDLFGDPRANGKDWRTKPLNEITSIERGKFTPRPRNDPRFYNGQFPFIQTGDIASSGGILSRWKQTLNQEGIAVSRSFPAGTIVIAIVGATIGETAILAREMYCPDSVIGIIPHDGVATPEYLEFSLRFFKQTFRDMAPETARANINLETLRPLRVPVPPFEMQSNFSTCFHKCYALRLKMSEPDAMTTDLLQSLLHRAFLGQL